jgi:peptidoglycan/LPS O-acetylase OafA/YrhL
MNTTDQASPEARIPGTEAHNSRMPELDGVRGIAIILVLLTHFFSYTMLGRTWTGIPKLIFTVTAFGWLGVDLFFILSGFLITGILFDTKGVKHYFRDFYMRRALRIFPLYLVVLAFLFFFRQNSGPFVLCGLLMATNLVGLFGIPETLGGEALWSLSVEEHFYLIWPWVIRNFSLVGATVISALVIVIEPAVRAYWRFNVYDVYAYSWFRFDGLALGALVSLFIRGAGRSRQTGLRAAALAACIAVAGGLVGLPFGIMHRGNRLGAAFQFTVPETLFAALVLSIVTLAGSRYTAVFRSRILTFFGDLSYCLYVIHMIVMNEVDAVVGRFIDVNNSLNSFSFVCVRALVVLLICIAVAYFSRRYFELPILRFKRYFAPPVPRETVPAAG